MINKKILLLFGVLCFSSMQGQKLNMEEIMKGNGFIGVSPEGERWSVDGQQVFFEWNPNNELGTSTYFWKKGMSKP
ncbi:MAG: hypothetical protein ACK4M4_09365, partial [Flavobacterium sp.]